MAGYRVIVKGTVQGVGFRPFVYRTAKKNDLKGHVRNVGNSVELLLGGREKRIEKFLQDLKKEHPPLAEIFAIDIKPAKVREYHDFHILKSKVEGEGGSVIPPDVALCKPCVQEIFDEKNRRYMYPFIVCTDCGPRFTIIEALPYDREKTTMKEFLMCEDCEEEYNNPLDRRFRAEPTCCLKCGPKYELFRGNKPIKTSNPIKKAAEALEEGKIVAIKGVGGTHLATKTTCDAPILRIRKIIGRPAKPFAIMARDMNAVDEIAYIGKEEKRLLESFRRPIVVLRKKRGKLSRYIAPKLHNIGVMLPYSGVHHLLFYYSKEQALVMTSANRPGEPMSIEGEEILALSPDHSLIHNRRIKNRCDDTVIKMVDGKTTFLRRSRGFVPQPIEVENNTKNVLSLGAELDVAACLLKGKKAFLSQYIGNTTKLKTLEYLEEAIYNLIELTKVEKVHAIAVDLHPGFNTVRLGTELSEKFGAKLIKCQHHHAHLASLMAENNADKVVGIAMDGVGYGTDGEIWGGEVLIAGFDKFKRVGSLMPQLLPGGDLATKFPARMVAGILSTKYSSEKLRRILINLNFKSEKEVYLVLKQIEHRFNTPPTTSTGRVLDAISTLLGLCYERTYEGEPAMKLEAFALKGKAKVDIPVILRKYKGRYILDTTEILDAVLQAKEKSKFEDIAASAQKSISDGLAEIAVRVAKKEGIKTIGASGGVAYNHAIIRDMRKKVEENGFEFLTQVKVPCGDGGVSLGQAAIAAEKIRN